MAARLTIVGLGPGDAALRTIAAQRALDAARRIILRTGIHPGIEDLLQDPRVSTCDDLYAASASFDELYDSIATRVLEAARVGEVVYAVPGHPLFAESTVRRILMACQNECFEVEIVAGVSFLDVIATTTGVDPVADEIQILDGPTIAAKSSEEPFSGGQLSIAPTRPCLIAQVYSRAIASAVKLALARVYPDEHEVIVLRSVGVGSQERAERCPLHELDHKEVDHLTTVWVPPLAPLAAYRSPATLHRIAAILRSPDGCPWDRKQTHETLTGAVIEEAYEVVDAIRAGEPSEIAEELGDLLLQVALHAQIAEEEGTFTIEDVYDHVNRKLIRRHPHVFGEVTAETADAVLATWQAIKAAERRERGEEDASNDPFDRLPRSMPVLTRVAGVLAETSSAPNAVPDPERLGDNLLLAVEAAVRAGLDPEQILEQAYLRRQVAAATT